MGGPYGEGSANFEAMRERNHAVIYRKTIDYLADQLAGRSDAVSYPSPRALLFTLPWRGRVGSHERSEMRDGVGCAVKDKITPPRRSFHSRRPSPSRGGWKKARHFA
jgi:hypothetical protein